MPFRPVIMPDRFHRRSPVSLNLLKDWKEKDDIVSIRIKGEVVKALGWGRVTWVQAAWDRELQHLRLSPSESINPSARSLNIRGASTGGELRWARVGPWLLIVAGVVEKRTPLTVVAMEGDSIVVDLSQLRKS